MNINCPYCCKEHPHWSPWHHPLSVEDGIKIQNDHLAEWESILKPEIYEQVVKDVSRLNHEAGCGHDIVRGQSIAEIVCGYRCHPNKI